MDKEPLRSNITALLDALDGHIPDEDTRGRLSVDLQDLVEASRWLLSTLQGVGSRAHTDDELESLLIDLEVRYLDHATYHIKSLRAALTAVLRTFPDD
jgi:hypothetical protein